MSFYNNVWADVAPMSEVNRLRNDAQITVTELATDVNNNFLLKEDFNKYNLDLQKKLFTLNRDNKNIISQLSNLTKILNEKLNVNIKNEASSSQAVPDDNASTGTRRDADNDVIWWIRTDHVGNKNVNGFNVTGRVE